MQPLRILCCKSLYTLPTGELDHFLWALAVPSGAIGNSNLLLASIRDWVSIPFNDEVFHIFDEICVTRKGGVKLDF